MLCIKKPLLLLLFLCVPMLVFANVIWPALLAERKIISVPIIALSILVEYFFFKYLFTLNKRKALSYTLLANAVSTLFGIVLRPLSGILWELSLGFIVNRLFDWGTFNPLTYISVPILGGAVNAFLELLTIRIVWKRKINGKNYFLTWLINIITITIAGIWGLIESSYA